MFIDLQIFSSDTNLIVNCSIPKGNPLQQKLIKDFPERLATKTQWINLPQSKFNAEPSKLNTPAQSVSRDFKIFESYTFQSCLSSQGLSIFKPTAKTPIQIFSYECFVKFAKDFVDSLFDHLNIVLDDIDRASMIYGLDIPLDFYLDEDDLPVQKLRKLELARQKLQEQKIKQLDKTPKFTRAKTVVTEETKDVKIVQKRGSQDLRTLLKSPSSQIRQKNDVKPLSPQKS